MITRNNLIHKVAGLVGTQLTGDTVLLLEQYIPVAIHKVSKALVDANDPASRSLLTTRTITPEAGTRFGYSYILLRPEHIKLVQNTLYKVAAVGAANLEVKMEPVQNFYSMELADLHGISYYKIDGEKMYYKLASGVSAANGVKVEHYEYLVLDDATNPFPDELEHFLVTELTTLVKNEQMKREVEGMKP